MGFMTFSCIYVVHSNPFTLLNFSVPLPSLQPTPPIFMSFCVCLYLSQ